MAFVNCFHFIIRSKQIASQCNPSNEYKIFTTQPKEIFNHRFFVSCTRAHTEIRSSGFTLKVCHARDTRYRTNGTYLYEHLGHSVYTAHCQRTAYAVHIYTSIGPSPSPTPFPFTTKLHQRQMVTSSGYFSWGNKREMESGLFSGRSLLRSISIWITEIGSYL